jgi:hypothetical protein
VVTPRFGGFLPRAYSLPDFRQLADSAENPMLMLHCIIILSPLQVYFNNPDKIFGLISTIKLSGPAFPRGPEAMPEQPLSLITWGNSPAAFTPHSPAGPATMAGSRLKPVDLIPGRKARLNLRGP